MQTMLGAMPGPIPLPRPRPGGIPGHPGWGPLGQIPGKKLVSAKISPTATEHVPHFRVPINQTPSAHETCLIAATLEMAAFTAALPRYSITALDQPNACAGAVLTITGTGFGLRGMVDFPGASKPVGARSWSDTRIQVVIPSNAAPGLIGLSILEGQFERCGQSYEIYRSGDTKVTFDGGIPEVVSLLVNYSKADSFAEPGATVVVILSTTDHPNVRVAVSARTSAGDFFTTTLSGGPHSFEFDLPSVHAPTECTVNVTVTGLCGSTSLTRTITIAQQPRLRIAHLEVTQALQTADNSVRLAANRATGVRAYITSGLTGFTFASLAGNHVPNVQATLTILRNTIPVATVKPVSSPPSVGPDYDDAHRSEPIRSFNFVLPSQPLDGKVELRVDARIAPLPHGVSDDPVPSTSSSTTVEFHPRQPVVLIRWRMRDDTVSPPIPAPTPAQWTADMVGAMDRFPVGIWLEGLTPGLDELSTSDDHLWTVAGWQDRLDDLDDLADRFADSGQIFVCVVPNAAYELNGIAHKHETRNWPRSDQHRVMLVRTGNPASYAHEMAHTLGIGHAPDADRDKEFPKDIDPWLPRGIEPGVVGWRWSDGTLFPPRWPELMTYRTPWAELGLSSQSHNYQDRWPSVATWDIIFDMLA
jgi:hypothetical protein